MTDGLVITYGDFALTGTDDQGVQWRVLSPVEGWDGSPASTLQLTQRPRGAGAFVASRPQLAARTIVMHGLIEAPDADGLAAACERLVGAITLDSQVLTITRGTTTRWANVYRQDEVLINEEHDTLASFSLQVAAADPRRFGDTIVAHAYMASTTGGITFPAAVPWTVGTSTLNRDVTLTNPGAVNGTLRLQIIGPTTVGAYIQGPRLSHTNAAGVTRTLTLPGLKVNNGETLFIGDLDTQFVRKGGRQQDQYLGQRQWFSFEPGDNLFTFDADLPESTAVLTVTATPAW